MKFGAQLKKLRQAAGQTVDQAAHLPGIVADAIQQPPGIFRQGFGKIFFQDTGKTIDGAQWSAKVMRHGVSESLKLGIAARKLCCTVGDALFKRAVQALQIVFKNPPFYAQSK